MSIDEVSKKLNITKDTLRYYEKIGLIGEVPRTQGGLRDYTEQNYKRIDFLFNMRKAGVGIKLLKQYVDLISDGDKTVIKRKEILIKQKEILEGKLKSIEKTLEYLDYKIDNYDAILKDKK